jgi:hypothetical protein
VALPRFIHRVLPPCLRTGRSSRCGVARAAAGRSAGVVVR